MAKSLIDWQDDKSHVCVNPLLPKDVKAQLEGAAGAHSDLKGHIWLASSGTENFPKMIALSKHAMLVSAASVNAHLQMTHQGSWLNILPLFHAGGLGIHARAFLSESPVFDFSEKKWDPFFYVNTLSELKISHSSLTPTHVFDIVEKKIAAPKTLNGIIVGGGALSLNLHEEAHKLGWPVLTSYGMTEVCSQIATALHPTPKSKPSLLKHVSIRFSDDQTIAISSNALLSGYVHGNDPQKRFVDPKVDGWYVTQDKGKMESGQLEIFGRGSGFLKIGGELINFSDLEATWENIKVQHGCREDAVLIDLPDERLGRTICLAVVDPSGQRDFSSMVSDYYQKVLPIAKIRQIFHVDKIPRTELYKLKKEDLRNIILGKANGL